jgi:hypothetical protein
MKNQKGSVVFRRYRRLPNGKKLDAYKYGYKAWPISVKQITGV